MYNYQPLDSLPNWSIFLLTVLILLLASEAGLRLGKVFQMRWPDKSAASVGVMVGAALALLGFLLAFVTSIAIGIFNERRQLVISEANAIGTTYLRAGYLAEPYGVESRQLLREYVKLRLEGIEGEISGSIDEIAPEIDPRTHTQWVKVQLPATGLQQGQFGWLSLSCQAERQALLIPVSAVLHYGQLQAVKIVEDGRLHTRHIRTGKTYGDRIEVLSGLHDGDTLLANSGLML